MSGMTTMTPPSHMPAGSAGLAQRVAAIHQRFLHLENQIHHELVKHSITALRISLGLVFLGFGILKFFPGVSPAQNIVEATTHVLFLALIPGSVAIKIIATLECFIGICLLTNRWMRLTVWLLAFEFIGILSPIFIFPGRLFSGPHHAPTLLGQYCLKDIILVAGGLVVTAASFRGGRMIRTDLAPNVRVTGDPITDPEHKLRIVLSGLHDPEGTAALMQSHDMSEADFHDWRDAVLSAATLALTPPPAITAAIEPRTAVTTVTTTGLAAPADGRRQIGPLVTLLTVAVLRRS
jgi:putative oxidoreductase